MVKPIDEIINRSTTKQTREKAAKLYQAFLAEMLLSEIRKMTGKSQQEIADALGIKQPSLSKLEKQDDMHISTLQKVVKALGGELEIVVRFPKGSVKIDQFDGPRRGTKRPKPQEMQLI